LVLGTELTGVDRRLAPVIPAFAEMAIKRVESIFSSCMDHSAAFAENLPIF
jgi:hypothetical protein